MAKYKRIFLDGYSYYITIVTHRRNPILVENIELLRESFRVSKSKYSYVINAIVVLPDHIHMIITPHIATDYPKIIRAIKYHFSAHCDEKFYAHIEQSTSRHKEAPSPYGKKDFMNTPSEMTKSIKSASAIFTITLSNTAMSYKSMIGNIHHTTHPNRRVQCIAP